MKKILDNFFNYKPIFSNEEINEFFEKEVKQKAISYLWEEAWEKLQKAYDYAKKAHWNEKRLSWEPYIVHPVYVTKYLLLIEPWIFALQAALLHDVIEDTPITWEDIMKEFWPEVAFLCLWLEKVWRVRYSWEDRQLETLKKTFLAMGQDIRVIFIKLADRIHNIQTLHFHPKKEKQIRIANETLKIYVPIAKRLWIEKFQVYLENGCFKILNEKEFTRIYNYLNKYYAKVNINKILENLKNLLNTNNIRYIKIKWRVKSPYRVYLKLIKYKTNNIDEIKDILAFRIITEDISTCYKILWVIHSKYIPIIKKIKDYISVPKANGYQSLHTTVLWLYKTSVEIQIRTKKMDDMSEYGLAAHFLYKEWEKKINKKQIEWVNKLKEISNEYKENIWENKHFYNILSIDFLANSVFVYTPKWTIIEIPKWWTVLDFAFRIHTDIWLKFKSAFVNWKIVPIDHKLVNGDIVEIKTFRNKYSAKRSWLEYIISPTNKTKLRSFLNHQEREFQIQSWEEILNLELEKLWLPKIYDKSDKIFNTLWENELKNNLVKIFNKNIHPIKFIRNFYKIEDIKVNKENEEKYIEKQIDNLNKNTNKVVIDNSTLFKYNFCPECNPTNKEQIIWKVTKEWVKIHSIWCKALKKVNYQKLIEAHWLWEEQKRYKILIKIDISDDDYNIVDIINLINSLKVKVSSIDTINEKKKYLYIKTIIKLPSTLSITEKKLKSQKWKLFKSFKLEFIN